MRPFLRRKNVRQTASAPGATPISRRRVSWNSRSHTKRPNSARSIDVDMDGPSKGRADSKSRFWGLAVGASGIVGVVLALGALVVALFAWLSPRSAPPSAGNFKVVSIDVGRMQDIEFEPYAEDRATTAAYKAQESIIDIQMFNGGGRPLLFKELTVEVLYAKALDDCLPPIGGPLGFSALYDFTIPSSIQTPSTLRANKPYKLESNDYDRLAVTLGPDGRGAWIYTVRLGVVEADLNKTVTLGTVTLASPNSALGLFRAQPFSDDLAKSECLRTNSDIVEGAMRFGGVTSTDLMEWQKQLRAAVDKLDRTGSGVLHSGPAYENSWAANTLDDCNAVSSSTELLSEDRADLTSDGWPETILTQSCTAVTSSLPNVVRVFDGTGSQANPKLLGIVIRPEDGIDNRGLRVQSIEAVNGRLVVHSVSYRTYDPNSSPSVWVTDRFRWNGTSFERDEPRSCMTRQGIPAPCTP